VSDLIDLSTMIRPWYRGSDSNSRSEGDHIFRDCEALADQGVAREGVGWLNPLGTDVCEECRERYDPEAYVKWASDEYE
jgi:hypothetical protein